ncbi:hypothetical protein VNO80_21841 [Phaseolus coccineus]|uniref:Uncharacterized protein n=1 Tax=Phaseolus coccineus TaxID=3886 RepID=A0AAN9M3S4_PHACN
MVLRLGLDYDASQIRKASAVVPQNMPRTGSITFTVYAGRMQSQQASILHLNLGISTDAGVHYSKPMYQLERLIATSSSSPSSSPSSSWKGKLLY